MDSGPKLFEKEKNLYMLHTSGSRSYPTADISFHFFFSTTLSDLHQIRVLKWSELTVTFLGSWIEEG
jgi:hypothetical protein